jgi:hypothetical protein
MTHLYPLERHTCASPIPVLPAVPSTTVPPGFNLRETSKNVDYKAPLVHESKPTGPVSLHFLPVPMLLGL